MAKLTEEIILKALSSVQDPSQGSDIVALDILTAAHVISRATHIEVVDHAGKTMPARIHAVDERRDIAFLTTDLVGPAVEFGTEALPIGSHVYAIGNSFGLGNSISCGTV